MALEKKGPKETIKGFSYVYLFFAVLGCIFAILVLLVPNFNEALKQVPEIPKNISPKAFFVTSIITSSLCDLWYFWLARRYANGKSKGYFYMVLLILGVISGLVSIFTGTKNYSSINFIIALVGLILMIRAKKSEQ